jgi:hypothetical protein
MSLLFYEKLGERREQEHEIYNKNSVLLALPVSAEAAASRHAVAICPNIKRTPLLQFSVEVTIFFARIRLTTYGTKYYIRQSTTT